MRRHDCQMHFWTLAMEPHYQLWMLPQQRCKLHVRDGVIHRRPITHEA